MPSAKLKNHKVPVPLIPAQVPKFQTKEPPAPKQVIKPKTSFKVPGH